MEQTSSAPLPEPRASQEPASQEPALQEPALQEPASQEPASQEPASRGSKSQEPAEQGTAAEPAPERKPPSPQPAEPEPNTLRLVIVHGGELLASERRELAELEKGLRTEAGVKVEVIDAPSPSERVAARTALDAPGQLELPAAWASAEHVVVLEVRPPVPYAGKRMTQGLGGIAILRPPSPRPLYREQGKHGGSFFGEGLAIWMADAPGMKVSSGGGR